MTSNAATAPEGYGPLAKGQRCRCVMLWQTEPGAFWCCSPGTEKQAEALKPTLDDIIGGRLAEERERRRREFWQRGRDGDGADA